jgi:hypothetical protein
VLLLPPPSIRTDFDDLSSPPFEVRSMFCALVVSGAKEMVLNHSWVSTIKPGYKMTR